MLCYDMRCYVALCCVVLCYVMLCCAMLDYVVPEGDAIMTRWPEAFSRVVPEGDALAYDFRVRVGAVLLHS